MERTRTEIVEFLHYLEKKFPVNSWTFQGHCLWPYLKIKLFFELLRKQDEPESKIPNGGGRMWYRLLVSIPEFFRIYWRRGSARQLYCGASHFKQLENGTYKTRYFNQLIAASQAADQAFLLLEYESSVPAYETKVDHPARTLHIHKITPLLHFWKRMKLFFVRPRIAEAEELNELLSELQDFSAGELQLSLGAIQEELTYIGILKSLYKRILKNHQVEEVYVLCYYNRLMLPMMFATYELGIPSVDIQHGGQGEEHMAYAGFHAVPRKGYSALPKTFWCWDQGSARVLRRWMDKQDYHQVRVQGNPWLDHQKEAEVHALDEARKIILYTLQPEAGEILEEYIIEAIQKTSSEYAWWLRLHPRQMERRQELYEVLRNNQIESKVVVDQASRYSLPFLLGRSHVHISKYSGSILEAYLLNRRSIIISEMGARMFPEVVASSLGYVRTEPDSDALLATIYSVDQTGHKFVN